MSKRSGFVGWALHEFKKTALATAYLLLGFNLLALMLVLLVPGGRSAAELFGQATVLALVVGKVIVVSDGVFNRLSSGAGSFLVNVLTRAFVFTAAVIFVLGAEEVVHGVVSDDLSWRASVEHLFEESRGGRRLLARFAYLMVMFVAYGTIFEFDRYFVGMSIADVILSRHRTVTTTEHVVMRIGLSQPLPERDLEARADVIRELYAMFTERVRGTGGELHTYQGRAGLVLWPPKVSTAVCRELFDEVSEMLSTRAEEHERLFGRRLILRAGVARGPVQTLEVTSGDTREIIRTGHCLDVAEQLFESAEPGEVRLASELSGQASSSL